MALREGTELLRDHGVVRAIWPRRWRDHDHILAAASIQAGQPWQHAEILPTRVHQLRAWPFEQPRSREHRWRRTLASLRASVRPPSGKVLQVSTVLALQPVVVTPSRHGTARNTWRRSRIHAAPACFQALGLRGKLREWAPIVRTHAPRPTRRTHLRDYFWMKHHMHLANLQVRLAASTTRRVRRIRATQSTGTFTSGNLPKLGDKTILKVHDG